jgi:hypothetical protein
LITSSLIHLLIVRVEYAAFEPEMLQPILLAQIVSAVRLPPSSKPARLVLQHRNTF